MAISVEGYGNITQGNAKEIYVAWKRGEVQLDPSQQKKCESFLTPEDMDEVQYDTKVTENRGKNSIDTSDAKTCELYNSYNTKMDPNQACSLKYYGTTYTSTTERTSTCYTNCRLYSSGGYNPQYTCDVNILKCKPVYYVQNYRYECKADCN